MQHRRAALAASPRIHHSDASLAHLQQLTRPDGRPVHRPRPSSRHGVGYSAAISDPERRFFCQHSDHDSGGGELGWRADRKAAPARRGCDLKCGDVRDVAGEQARCTLAPLHRPMLARDFTVANSS